MPESTASGNDSNQNPARQLVGDVAQAIQLRRDLVELELRHNIGLAKRLAILGGIGAVLVLIGLPVLVGAAANALAAATTVTVVVWSVILAGLLIVPGVLFLIFSIRRFRNEFTAFEHSLTELKEDVLWLKEWLSLDNRAERGPNAD